MDIKLDYRPRLQDLTLLGNGKNAAAKILGPSLEAQRLSRRSKPSTFDGRTGYDQDFLGFTVPLPKPTAELARYLAPVSGSVDNQLRYEHFSVMMHSERRLAMCVAVNIFGEKLVPLTRKADTWSLDGRISDEYQVGEDLYSDNILDRGHLVRRQDPVWGTTAEIGNGDTFHFTNCAPQAATFNQKTWLGLEDYVLKNAKIQQAKVTVFTGPVFKDGDRAYRGVKIPTAYWKVLSFVDDLGRPSATAYLVDQVTELKDLEAVFGAYKTYQRSVAYIERLTRFSFNGLADFDGFSNEESATRTSIISELNSPADIRL